MCPRRRIIVTSSMMRSLAAMSAAVLLAACGAASPTPGASRSTAASGTASPARILVTDAQNGATLTAHLGDRVEVRLGSTYWKLDPNPAPSVLKPEGPPVVSPQPAGCVPGSGCGIVTAAFVAVGAGSATLTASRTSCGEAMGCTAAEASFRVTVDVAG
jgi:hypothetical protein